MLRLKNIEKEQFDEYVENHKTKSHFLQSLSWGEFSKAKKNLTPYYLGLVNDKDELVGATLLLEKHLPMNYTYFYAPRGFVIDYKKKELVREMTEKVVNFAIGKKAIFVKIDPDLIKTRYNYLDEEIKNDDFEEIFNTLKSVGFKHLGFTKNFETMQPRYTFRVDLTQSMEDIEAHFSKTTKQRIAKSKKLNTEVVIGTTKEDVAEFYHLMTLTESRKDFISYNEDYYQTLYEIFNNNKRGKATLFLGKVHLDKIIESLENTQKDIEKYEGYKKEYGNDLTLSAHMIIEYGDKAWVLYAGNHNILSETYVNYNTYYEHLKYCKEKGIKIYDQFGTIGDLSKDNPRLGLHEFKKKFGGDYVEFIGEWDYVTNKFMYFVFTKLVPLYRKMVRKKSKKVLENEINNSK